MAQSIDGQLMTGIGATIVSLGVNIVGWVENHNEFIAATMSVIVGLSTLVYWHMIVKIKRQTEQREQKESDARILALGKSNND